MVSTKRIHFSQAAMFNLTSCHRVAACLGLPMLIDITDCDCLLPSPYEITSNPDGTTAWHITEHQPYAILTEHLKLSILLGRVLKCVYR
jgi:hypothetical protein